MNARAADYAAELAREVKHLDGTVTQDGIAIWINIPLDQKTNVLKTNGALAVILARAASSTYVSLATRGFFHHCGWGDTFIVLPPTAACQQPYLEVSGLLSTAAPIEAPAAETKSTRKRKMREWDARADFATVMKRARSAAREEGLNKLMECIKHNELKHGHASALASFLYDVQKLGGGTTKMTVHATHEFADNQAKKHIVTVREYERVAVERLSEVCNALRTATSAAVVCSTQLLHFDESPSAYAFRFEIDLP